MTQRLLSWTRPGAQLEAGQSMVEYGIIVALVAVVVIALIATMGQQLSNIFSTIVSEL